jgi:hypothetical protein
MSFSYVWPLAGQLTTVQWWIESSDRVAKLTLRHSGLGHLWQAPGSALTLSQVETMWSLQFRYLRDYLELGEVGPRFDYGAPWSPTIRQAIPLPVPAKAVWVALTEPWLLNQWVATAAEVEPWPGGRYRYGWAMAGVGPEVITVWDEPRRLQFSWRERGEESWVTWTLEDGRLILEHTGLLADPALLADYTVGWFDYLYALRALLVRQRPSLAHANTSVGTAALKGAR